MSILVLSIFSFQGGDGTPGNPYNISTCAELQNMSSNLSAHYQLISDVDCGVAPFDSAPWFTPIGNCTGVCWSGGDENPFEGSFEGNSFTISDLTIINTSGTGNSGWGLFSYSSGDLTNINLENVFVNVSDGLVGSLVGYSNFADISNSSASGSVTGDNIVGGLVGYSNFADISNSYASGSVTGNNTVGGLVGYSERGNILNSYASGSVTGNDSVGGLVGHIKTFNILNSYANGSVIGNDSVGGLVGYSANGDISNSYSSGFVTGNDSVGGFIGDYSSVTVTNSFWNNVSGNPNVSVGIGSPGGITPIQDNISYFYDITREPFAGDWDTGVWNFTGTNLPFLSWQENPSSTLTLSETSSNVSSLFPLGNIFISIILILGFFIFR